MIPQPNSTLNQEDHRVVADRFANSYDSGLGQCQRVRLKPKNNSKGLDTK